MTRATEHETYMEMALREAMEAGEEGEVPVGAIVVAGARVIARAHNMREAQQDPSAHAEVLALRRASSIMHSWRLPGSTLYVTLEPCIMCMGAALLARVEQIVFGAWDPKGGAAGSVLDLSNLPGINHRIELVGGILEPACAGVLSSFFSQLRRKPALRDEGRRDTSKPNTQFG